MPDWQLLSGALTYLSSGFSTLWGVNAGQQIYYMKDITFDGDKLKFQWASVGGSLKQISSSPGEQTDTLLIVK
jgi:hypothetical protein